MQMVFFEWWQKQKQEHQLSDTYITNPTLIRGQKSSKNIPAQFEQLSDRISRGWLFAFDRHQFGPRTAGQTSHCERSTQISAHQAGQTY
jgi:hypothetical protein